MPSFAPSVTSSRVGEVLQITLARPERGNTIDLAFADQLASALHDVDPEVRVILLCAAGDNFCVGGDVRQFGSAERPGEFIGRLAEIFHEAVLALAESPRPTVAAVRGWAAGAGIGLAAACDIIVCGRSARFRPAYLSLGLSPDGGVTWALSRALGQARALDLLLTDGVLTAEQAHRAGLVSRIVDDAHIDAEALKIAELLARGPAAAYARTKQLVRTAAHTTLADQLQAEALAIAASAEHPEGREGVSAFIARRPADFYPRLDGNESGPQSAQEH
ncbi:MAG: Enoyl-CoA hydratase/isomerase [Streptosporangiaceae bacterium]|jgi:2-(1,2-epoxy-1,2-dihydrophenyl)acetyl-CoA isomerase|nr:Enoyl-CoA hydratase/isomerase [Streptosporangiaceae bacterium]